MSPLCTLTISITLFGYLSFKATPSSGQVSGCTDPGANNYNAAATVNDGSCTYNVTSYTPPVKVNPISSTVTESSGLQMAGGSLWSFNDSGGDAAIYRVDTTTGNVLQTVYLGGATNVDWEDIAFDGTYLYIGDFGNNVNGARTDLKIYKFPFSAIPANDAIHTTVTIPASQIQIINFSYSDQVPVTATSANSTKFDCEAMIVDGGKIHLFTKNWIDLNSTHYVISSTDAGTYKATPLETLATGYLVTGADKVAGKKIVALIGYVTSNFGNHYMHLLSDFSGGYYFNGNKRKLNLPTALDMGQSEGITFRNDTYGYISNEKLVQFGITINQQLHSFSTSAYLPAYVLPLDLKSFSVTNINGTNKIAWSFSIPVQHVKLQYSLNSTNFTDISTYPSSTSEVYYHKVETANNYYRLAWQKNNEPYKYSRILYTRNNEKRGIHHITIKANGELSFTINGTTPVTYAFRLITTDGKLLCQMKEQAYTPGSYAISFLKDLPANQVVFLIMYNNTESKSVPLFVEKQ